MPYNTAYEAIVTKMVALLEGISTIKKVFAGKTSSFRLSKLPLAIIEPPEEEATKISLDQFLLVGTFDVYIIIRETVPANWFSDISALTGAVIDAVMADRTLTGSVKDIHWTFHSPGQITVSNKLFYGGIIRFKTQRFYDA